LASKFIEFNDENVEKSNEFNNDENQMNSMINYL